jgi:AcrR family transcriptional regulator
MTFISINTKVTLSDAWRVVMARTGRPRTFDRSHAIDLAMQTFWTHGYDSTSLSLLKDAMGGISAPSFYAAFHSKEALFEEVLDRYLQTHGQVMASLYDPEISPREAVEQALLRSALMQTNSDHPPGCLLVISATTCPSEASAVQDILKQDRLNTRQGFQRCVARAMAVGELPSDTDAKSTGLMLDTFVRGFTSQARDGVSFARLRGSIQSMMKSWSPQKLAAGRPQSPH